MNGYRMICANCKWWEPDAPACCRYPPHPRYGSPETVKDCWCGEFALVNPAKRALVKDGAGESLFKVEP